MRGFEVSEGDLVIINNELSMVVDKELKAQTIQSVTSTNKGEWLFDEEEGINFDNIFSKQPEEVKKEIVRNEIEQGVSQVDDTLNIDDFECTFDKNTRILSVTYTAIGTDGEEMAISTEY